MKAQVKAEMQVLRDYDWARIVNTLEGPRGQDWVFVKGGLCYQGYFVGQWWKKLPSADAVIRVTRPETPPVSTYADKLYVNAFFKIITGLGYTLESTPDGYTGAWIVKPRLFTN